MVSISRSSPEICSETANLLEGSLILAFFPAEGLAESRLRWLRLMALGPRAEGVTVTAVLAACFLLVMCKPGTGKLALGSIQVEVW